MQLEEATVLRKNWGNKPCEHPSFEKEYHLGASTGDYICTKCGRAFWGNPDRDDLKKEIKK